MEKAMSDNQRRFYCRLLFLFFCCLPTSIMVYRAFHPQTPEMWQQRIESELGMDATIVAVETPSPRETILRGLTLLGPDRRVLLSAIETRIRYGKLADGQAEQQILVREQVRITSDNLKWLADTLEQRMPRDSKWRIRMEHVVIEPGATDDVLANELHISPADIEIDGSGGTSSAVLTMTVRQFGKPIDGAGNITSAEVSGDGLSTVRCDVRQLVSPGQSPQTSFFLDTRNQALPCWLAQRWLPQLRELGNAATFRGRFGIDPLSPDIYGRVQGRFENVALPPAQAPVARIPASIDSLPTRSTAARATATRSTATPRSTAIRLTSADELPIAKFPSLGAIDLDMTIDENRGHDPIQGDLENDLAQDPSLKIRAVLELPDGSRQPMIPEYQFQQVLKVGSAIKKTVQSAQSRSAFNY